MAAAGETVTYRELDARVQPAGASVPQSRPEAARSLFDLHGEQQPLSRSLRRRRTLRPVLHLRELLPDAGRTRLHPHQQRVAHPDHLEGKTRCRARGAQAMPEGRALHRRRRRRARASASSACARPRRACRTRRSPTNASAPRCSIRPAPPAGRRAFCGRCRNSRPTQQSAAVRFPGEDLAVPRGHDLSVAGAALSFRAAGRRQSHHPDAAAPPSSWSSFDPERYLAAGREMGRHAHPAGADDVLADAEAAGGGAHATTICRRSKSPSMPRRRARRR